MLRSALERTVSSREEVPVLLRPLQEARLQECEELGVEVTFKQTCSNRNPRCRLFQQARCLGKNE